MLSLIAKMCDLDMLNMFAVSTYHLSLIVFEIKVCGISRSTNPAILK
jgi:hypothetical protein